MKLKLFSSLVFIVCSVIIQAQVSITDDGSSADPSAMLEIKSTTKGLLLPRMSQAERDGIASPVAGLVVWCTNCGVNGQVQVYNGSFWTNLTGGTADITCGSDFTDLRNGITYGTVLIGTQCWMAENLNIGTMVGVSSNQANNGVIEKYCYGNITTNCDVYGGLYQWNEMMQYSTNEGVRGICPDGWHLPTDGELTLLVTYLGGEGAAGGAMKETGLAYWSSPNTGATNSSGFTGLPGGYAVPPSSSNINTIGYFWTSTQFDGSNGYYRNLNYNNTAASRNPSNKAFGFSVRCVKNN
ncbi:MAG: fibrobacter succinogenes major paralogous domain-containing protein [Bacteroidales bacterium]|nr:fibrobacter succinogenes major paralogous domain-containing protein [Bacteroidales bacterium]